MSAAPCGRVLVIEPRGGLCNRMRSIDGAAALVADTGMTLHIVWTIDQGLGCPLDALFEPVPGVSRVTQRRRFVFRRRDLVWLRRHAPFGRRQIIYLPRDVERLLAEDHDFTTMDLEHGVYIRTGKRIHRSLGPAQLFRLQPSLRAEVDRFAPHLQRCIGVHIRHTDHRPGSTFSPTSLFAARIEELLRSDRDRKFFLCTDDEAAERDLLNAFPRRILLREKGSRNRSTARAIADAAIDLYCLSRTQRVLGTTASSFSRMATELGGQPLELVSSRDQEPLQW